MDVTDLGVAPETIQHPFASGLHARSDDVDSMADLLMQVKEQRQRLQVTEQILRTAIAAHAKSPNKTCRVQGNRYRCKIVRPDPYWAQKELKEIWNAWDEATTFLRIATLAPNMREVKKLEAMDGNPEFQRWKKKLLSARQESNSAPTVTIEE